ncbi:hypothetical protein [Anaerophaga thermohalophila]|nr:hypothetical protein [Anaerophaga thermohalophila]
MSGKGTAKTVGKIPALQREPMLDIYRGTVLRGLKLTGSGI